MFPHHALLDWLVYYEVFHTTNSYYKNIATTVDSL